MKIQLSDFSQRYECAMVTGGAGFIGSHLVDALLKLGVRVISIDDYSAGKAENLESARKSPNFKEITGDICDPSVYASAIKEADIIFHQACSKNTVCMRDPSRDLAINGDATLRLVRAAVDAGIKKFVHASTGSVYGEPKVFPTDETHPLHPVSYYGVSKLAGERYVAMVGRMTGLDTTILRYHHVFGPRQDNSDVGGVVSIFARNVVQGAAITIFGTGEQVRSFTYVDDIVAANIFSALHPDTQHQAFNCASGIKVTITDLAKKVVNYFKAPEHPIKYADWKPGDIINFNVSNEKLKSLGFQYQWEFDEAFKVTMASVVKFLNEQKADAKL